MQIILDIDPGADGRLSGTAARRSGRALPFCGNLELVARVEQLATDGHLADPRGDQTPKGPGAPRRDFTKGTRHD